MAEFFRGCEFGVVFMCVSFSVCGVVSFGFVYTNMLLFHILYCVLAYNFCDCLSYFGRNVFGCGHDV